MQTNHQQTSTLSEWIWIELMIHHPRHHCRDESTLNHSTLYPHFSATTTSKSNTSFVAYAIDRLLSTATFRLAFLLHCWTNTIQYNSMHTNDLFAVFKIRFELENDVLPPWVVLVMTGKNMHKHINWTVFGQTLLMSSHRRYMQFGWFVCVFLVIEWRVFDN